MTSKPEYLIAPSILSADFARLGAEVDAVLEAGADVVHFDVMDNHYVPNLTIGPLVCEALRKHGVTAPIDVHLMVSPVDRLVGDFAAAGATYISFHPEASEHVHRTDGSHGKKKSHAAMLAAATGDFGDLFTADTDEDSDDLGSDADGAKPLDDDELDDLVERLDMQAHAAGHAGGELDWQGESGRARDAAASMTRDGSFLVAAKGLMQHAGGGPLSIGLKGLVSGFAEGGAAEDALQKARENAADAAAASVMAAYHADNEGGGSDEDEDDCVVEDCLVGILVKRAMKVRQGERGP